MGRLTRSRSCIDLFSHASTAPTREYLGKHIGRYKTEEAAIDINTSDLIPYENAVPLYDLKAAAGGFSDIQSVDDFDWVKIPPRYKATKDLFAFTVVGESMNKIIPNGAVCLFKKYDGGSRNGIIVLLESTRFNDSDFGSHYTIKEYFRKKTTSEEGWGHEEVILLPKI
ncbi:MAG: hypothetical protein EOO85_19870 [Pedobacter sp.]|nr:MAG: hypothetical protein EOO85_19870 [Pedobacter sp.]